MDLQHTILFLVGILLILGVAAAVAAWHFGRQYQSGGTRRQKYICVTCCVASCVCIITAIQILLMFRNA